MRARLGNGAGQGLWSPPASLWHPPATSHAAPERARRGPSAPAGGLRRRGLRELQPKAFTPRTTDSTHGQRCSPNLLRDQPKTTQANLVWVSDMASDKEVGWQVGATVPEELVTNAFQRAFGSQPSTPGLLVHSDLGRTR